MKTLYRTHPDLGFHQSTKVTTAEAEAQLRAEGWADEMPAGFVEGSVPGDSAAPVVGATIEVVVSKDVMGA